MSKYEINYNIHDFHVVVTIQNPDRDFKLSDRPPSTEVPAGAGPGSEEPHDPDYHALTIFVSPDEEGVSDPVLTIETTEYGRMLLGRQAYLMIYCVEDGPIQTIREKRRTNTTVKNNQHDMNKH